MSDAARNDVAMDDATDPSTLVVSGTTDAETMALASGVMETIVQLALRDVEGVSGLGVVKGRRKLFGSKPHPDAVEVTLEEDGAVVALHLSVNYGQVLPEVAAAVRQAVAEALASQVGVTVKRIDVFVDSITF